MNLAALQGRVKPAFIALLRRLPPPWVSALGRALGARNARRGIAARRLWVERLHRNLAALAGLHEVHARTRAIIEHRKALGAVHVEFASLQRMVATGRVELVGGEHLRAHAGPVLIAGAHLANWELLGLLLRELGRPAVALYMPPPDVAEERVALHARRAWYAGLELVSAASPGAMRRVVSALRDGHNALLYVDEEAEGYIRAPRLGRDVPLLGNLSMAARLAARSGAALVPAHVEAAGAARYRIVVEPALDPGTGDAEARAARLAAQLDVALERWVRADPLHWYWLGQYEHDRPPPRRTPT